jgi:hypothetical protein
MSESSSAQTIIFDTDGLPTSIWQAIMHNDFPCLTYIIIFSLSLLLLLLLPPPTPSFHYISPSAATPIQPLNPAFL